MITHSSIRFYQNNMIFCLHISVPLPCIMSEWTKWSSVDASGTVFRYRYVLRPALNGGKACEDLLQLKKGTLYIIENSLKSYQFI